MNKEVEIKKEREVLWWPGEERTYDYSLTPEENRKRHEEKKKEFVKKYPERVLYTPD